MSYTLLKNSEGNAPSQGELGNHDSPSFWETFWRRNRGWKVAVLATVVILPWIANMLLFGLIYLHMYPEKELLRPRRADNAGFPQITYSPAQHLIEYNVQKWNQGFGWDRSIYQGSSSTEIDHAWDELYHGITYSRIPKHQAALLANKTSPIPGDDGHYVVMLNVFHEPHCLNMIRKKLYPEYYTDPELEDHFRINHIEHCIDSIRSSLMCSADITPMVWQWWEPDQKFEPRNDVVHTCRNFEKIHQWAMENPIKEQIVIALAEHGR